MHSANTDQALPALLLTRTWWDSARALGAMAIETVAAPFLLFRDRKRYDDTVGIGGHDCDASTAPAVEPRADL